MNKQQLASRIWESANKMRSKIEANEYKDYILGFIFYKFLSEMEVSRLKARGFSEQDLPSLREDDAELVEFVRDECGFFISYDNLFSTWLAKGKDFAIDDVRDALSAFNRNINKPQRRVFEGVFDTLQAGLSKLGTDARSQSKAVRDLVQLIRDIPMDARQDYDVLGFIYEYLISNFAANAGKKAGEFYTPHEVSQLMSEIVAWHLAGRDEIKIYDPTSGSGSLLINIGKAVARRNGNPDSIKYYAQELKENTYNLTRMNLVMRGILPDNIVARNGDTLEDDWPWFDTEENKEETYEPLFVDAVVSNPPYSQRWDPADKELDPRFKYGVAPKSKADYAFLLHDLYHLRPDGIMAIVLPHGVLFRGGEEGAIRKNLVENRHIQAIIGLPANIFFGTGIPTIVMVLRKSRPAGESGVLVIDASKHFVKDGKSNKLRASDIKRIVDAVTESRTVEGFSRLVPIEEIRSNDYNLNIPRYVDSSEPPETWDVYASMFGGVPKGEVATLGRYWAAWPSLRDEIYVDDGGSCLTPRDGDLVQMVRHNTDVAAFGVAFDRALSDLPHELRASLVEDPRCVDVLAEEGAVSARIERALEGLPLIDPYDAYQVLDDAWQGIAIDLEMIQTEGLGAVRRVDPRMVIKKTRGEDVEVQDGWTGHVLPFDLVQGRMLRPELSAISELETRVFQIDQELSELLENMDEEEKGSSDAVSEDGGAFVGAELSRAVKAIGKSPESDFDRALVRAKALLDEQKRTKKQIKASRVELESRTKETIESLSDEQCRDLLDAKWIAPLMEGLHALPSAAVDGFIAKAKALNEKYETTYSDVCEQIDEAEKELAQMLGQLTGNEYDMAGINELMSLLGGE